MDLFTKIVKAVEKRPVLSLLFIYFIIRFPQLTLLPIFNDESIYLDWGWRETHVPGFLYYSLYDAKQPFVMWFFGIFSNFFSDPLFAGRLFCLLLGLLSTYGIYLVGKDLYGKTLGLFASIVYIVTPIFVLFDRLALLESAITATGIWAFYFLTKSLKEARRIKYEIFTGLTLGLGYFSKSTAALFILATVIIFSYYLIRNKNGDYFKRISVILGSFFGTVLLLILNPQFWGTLSSNSRYVLTFGELIRFPVLLWAQNAWAMLQIGFLFLTPPVFLLACYFIFNSFRKKRGRLLVVWILAPLIIALLTLKSPSQRYIVGLLPLVTVGCAFVLFKFNFLGKKTKILTGIFIIIIPAISSFFLIYKPLAYFSFFKKITPYNEYGFIHGQVSGYAIDEAVEFLTEENKKSPIVVTYAENTGNPESALSVYFAKKKIMNGYFELKYLTELPSETQCIVMQDGKRIFFVSRNSQLAGFDRFVKKVKTIKKPLGTDTIGVYEFIGQCKNMMKVNPVFQG